MLWLVAFTCGQCGYLDIVQIVLSTIWVLVSFAPETKVQTLSQLLHRHMIDLSHIDVSLIDGWGALKSQEVLLKEVASFQHASITCTALSWQRNISSGLWESHTPSTTLQGCFIHLLSTLNSEHEDLGCIIAIVWPVYHCLPLSIVVKRHWRDTGQFYSGVFCEECFEHLTRTLTRSYGIMVAPLLG